MSYLPVKGLQVYYVMKGKGEPVLLLHGGLGTVEDFAPQIPVLAEHFQIFAFERSGHGHTADTAEPFGYDVMAKQTVAFIEALGLGATNLVGWSDGAIVALLVAISRPELVRSLVLVSGNFNTSGLTTQARHWIESATPESFRKEEPTLAERYDNATPDGPAHFSTLLEKTKKLWLNEPDIKREELGGIKVPALVMAADKEMVPIEHTIELFRAMKDGQLCIIPGATHFLLSEKPDMVNSIILDFLRKNERPAQS